MIIQALASAVWIARHLLRPFGILPVTLCEGSAEPIRGFEASFKTLVHDSMAIRAVSEVPMASLVLAASKALFRPAGGLGILIGIDPLLLAATAAHPRLPFWD